MPRDHSPAANARVFSYPRRSLKDAWQPLISGAVAGAVAKTAIAPLDRSKIHFQVSITPFNVRNLRNFLICTAKQTGILSLWRGNSATMARVIPYSAIQFAAHEQWKLRLSFFYGYPLPHAVQFCAGSLAGMSAVCLTYPLDMIRARMAVSSKDHYPNLVETVVKIYRQEGLTTFYRGFSPTILGIIPYAGVAFYTYEKLKQYHRRHYGDLQLYDRLCYGAVAGVCGQTSSYPLDVVRRRMQTAGVLDIDTHRSAVYRRLAPTLKFIFYEGGFVKGIYKGLSLNWIKGPIASGLSFTTFDLMQKLITCLSD